MVASRANPVDKTRPERVTWGTFEFLADEVQDKTQELGDRSTRLNHLISDFSGGLAISSRMYTLEEMVKSGEYSGNTGLITHIPGLVALGYEITGATSLISDNAIGWPALNRRVHAVDWNGRFIACMSSYLVKDTSTSNPVLTVPSTNDNISDIVGAITKGYFAGTYMMAIGAQGGTTDGLKGTTDPTANDITWTSIFAYSSGDSCHGMQYIPALGITVVYGKFAGVPMIGYLRATDPLGTVPTPFDLSTSVNPTPVTRATNQTLAGAGATLAFTGAVATDWTNPGNITALDGTAATIAGTYSTNDYTRYLYGDQFGFALESDDIVVGVEAMTFATVSGGVSDFNYYSVRLVDANGALFGNDASLATQPSLCINAGSYFARVWGGASDLWGAPLTPTIVNDADFGIAVSFECNNAPGVSRTISVDAIGLTVWYRRGVTLMSSTKSVGSWTQRTAQSAYFTSLGNIAASDDSDATATWQTGGGSDDTTTQIFATGFSFNLPSNAVISGVVAKVERAEGDAAANADDSTVQLLSDHSAVGNNKQQSDNLEFATADEDVYYGAPNDTWGATLTAAVVNSPGFGLLYQANLDANSITIDHISLTVYWYMPATILSLPLGGFMLADPSNSLKLWIVAPEEDDLTGVTKRRKLYSLTLSSTAGVASLTEVNTGLNNILDIWPHQGGVMIIGDWSSTAGSTLKHIDGNGILRSYRMPIANDGDLHAAWGGFDLGLGNIIEQLNFTDADTQWWVELNGTFHPEYAYNDTNGAWATANVPFSWAERTISAQRQIYRFGPDSTTAVAYTRAFVPRDMFSDPITTNTGEDKGIGSFYLTSPRFLLGEGENENALTYLKYLNDQISATTAGQSYGSVKLDVETGIDGTRIDTTFATPTITTGALTTPFAEYNVPANGEAGRAAMLRLTLANAAATSTKTPNGVPWYMGGVSYLPSLSAWVVYPVIDDNFVRKFSHWGNFVNSLKTLAATKRTQTFKWGNVAKTAALVGWDGSWIPPQYNTVITRAKGRPFLIFEEQRGVTS